MHWISQLEGGPQRVNHAAVAIGEKIYSFGGYSRLSNFTQYNSMDVHILNTRNFRWILHPVSQLPYYENDDILPFQRYGHTAAAYKDKVYVWGGRNDQGSCNVLFCYDAKYNCWTAPHCTGDIPVDRDGHTACVWRNRMYIFGGCEYDVCFAKSVYYIDLDTMHWTYVHTIGSNVDLDLMVRDFHTAVTLGNKMYVFGGRSTSSPQGIFVKGSELYCPYLWYLDLITHKWHNPTTYGSPPSPRRSHSAFVYNGKMYVFGGYSEFSDRHFNDLFEYDPESHWWTALNPLDPLNIAPCPRRRQACVVVANRLFLFGGSSPLSSYNTLLREISDEHLKDHSDMYVMDFIPSLKTLSLIAVKKHKINVSELPSNIVDEFFNMFTPNTIITPTRIYCAG